MSRIHELMVTQGKTMTEANAIANREAQGSFAAPSGSAAAWQPIETAPKDSTIIDIWKPSDGRLTAYRRVELSLDNIFYEPVRSGVCVVRDATHWMPIPEPPNDGTQRPGSPDGSPATETRKPGSLE
jgi:hypothetical protein